VLLAAGIAVIAFGTGHSPLTEGEPVMKLRDHHPTPFSALAALACGGNAYAAKGHVHGAGTLDVAIEGNKVSLDRLNCRSMPPPVSSARQSNAAGKGRAGRGGQGAEQRRNALHDERPAANCTSRQHRRHGALQRHCEPGQ
jgi:hypothetical protein